MSGKYTAILLVGLFLLGLGGCVKPPREPIPAPPLAVTDWENVDGWVEDDPRPAFEAFLESCGAVKEKELWQDVCAAAEKVDPSSMVAVRRFFHDNFVPHLLQKADGSSEGLITGYYAPLLDARREPSADYSWPIYGLPEDLLVIDLKALYPDLADYRLRGRLVGRRVVAYYDRGNIDGEAAPLAGNELFWLKDPVDVFFLHIQGSGLLRLESGETVMVSYADQNGHPYRSIGKLLLDRGEMTRDQMSMQNIKAWALENPDRVGALLAENPSYIFFSELSGNRSGPPGALGVPLTAGRSLAVDRRVVPLGAPVFLSSSWPNDEAPLRRLMVAQDTGGAIKGEVRADFYWGMGDEAGSLAGRMKQTGRLWLLLPAGTLDGAGFSTN